MGNEADRQPSKPDAVNALADLLDPCRLCPRQCRVHRRSDQIGFCGVGPSPVVSSSGPHFGEEPVLVGSGGSGTIFMAGCNLGCRFCQNYDISILWRGRDVTVADIVDIMLSLQKRQCVNINFVTPTHQAPFILEAILTARDRGLTVPIVYNCGGYETVTVLDLLAGAIDIYMPDVKFFDAELAETLTGCRDYPDVVRSAVKTMHQQVGDLVVEHGVARRGLLVRHLVMPDAVDDGRRIVDFLADEISPNTYLNVMAQYRPCYQADRFPQIARAIHHDEWRDVYDHAVTRGLRLAR